MVHTSSREYYNIANTEESRKFKKKEGYEEEITDKCWFHYYFRLLVFEYRAVDIPYFQDVMRLSELQDVIENIPYIDRTVWDTTRIACLISAQKASKKKLRLRDIFPLPWDSLDQTEQEMINILKSQKAIEDYINSSQKNED